MAQPQRRKVVRPTGTRPVTVPVVPPNDSDVEEIVEPDLESTETDEDDHDATDDQPYDSDSDVGDTGAENDVHTVGGVGQHMDASLDVPIPVIKTYPSKSKASPPPDSYVVGDDEDPAQPEWFIEDEINDNLVTPRRDIVRKVFPMNTVTPTYILVAPRGVQMTKAHANELTR